MALVSDYNMPPGASASDIPGNRKEDGDWEDLFDLIGRECGALGITVSEAYGIWFDAMMHYKCAAPPVPEGVDIKVSPFIVDDDACTRGALPPKSIQVYEGDSPLFPREEEATDGH